MPTPAPLNYHHLRYFWAVARSGSITQACRELNLTQPAVSAQLRTFQRAIGEQLFTRSGRGLVLTDIGQVVFRYADEIFRVGVELQETLAGRPSGLPPRFTVGMTESMPKLLAYKLLEPALHLPRGVRLTLREDRLRALLPELVVHALDLVISDEPVSPSANVRAYNHLLGECGITFFAARGQAARYRRGFPRSLHMAPMVAPPDHTALRRSLDAWFSRQDVRPAIVAEIEDSAVLKVFGQSGTGFFAAPSAVEAEVHRQYEVEVIRRVQEVRERFYAISVERKVHHPAVMAIAAAARREVFG